MILLKNYITWYYPFITHYYLIITVAYLLLPVIFRLLLCKKWQYQPQAIVSKTIIHILPFFLFLLNFIKIPPPWGEARRGLYG
jgi:hypothetical protein